MSFFDDNPFDSIVREFFGENPRRGYRRRNIIRGEDEEQVIDLIESDDKVYLIFELSGYNEEDIFVEVNKKQNLIAS